MKVYHSNLLINLYILKKTLFFDSLYFIIYVPQSTLCLAPNEKDSIIK